MLTSETSAPIPVRVFPRHASTTSSCVPHEKASPVLPGLVNHKLSHSLYTRHSTYSPTQSRYFISFVRSSPHCCLEVLPHRLCSSRGSNHRSENLVRTIKMATLSPPSSPPHHDGNSRPHRPRAVSSMSRASTSSRRSDHSANKLDLVESSKDKKRLHTKADPSVAVHEAQPCMIPGPVTRFQNANNGQLK